MCARRGGRIPLLHPKFLLVSCGRLEEINGETQDSTGPLTSEEVQTGTHFK
jgi:hypothetical protein